MKFVRNDLNEVKEEATAPDVEVDDVNITEPEQVLETAVEATAVVEEVPTAAEAVSTVHTETLEEKYKIPEFEPKVRIAPESTPVEEKIDGADVKGIELVNEVPEGEPVLDGVEIVGDLAPEVEEKLEADLSVAKEEVAPEPAPIHETPVPEWTGNCEKCGAPEHLCTCNDPVQDVKEEDVAAPVEEPLKEEPKQEEEPSVTAQDSWEKLIDFVIVPTILTCLDRAKDFVSTVLAADLKKNNPDA